MSHATRDPRQSRLLGLALAKGWIGEESLSALSLEELVHSGQLIPSQAEALGRELDWGVAQLDEDAGPDMAPTAWRSSDSSGARHVTQPGVGSTLFSAAWIRSWAHFEDLVLLAEGGMGRIFKAKDTRLRRTVALKMLRREDTELEIRLVREAELQARISHPNVCGIHEAGFWNLQAYIAMEFIDGATFSSLAASWALEEKLVLMIQVCEGVHAAHRQGLIHRDLKPTNLMAVKEERGWRAVVMDFGLARPIQGGHLTQAGTVLGTVHYMSPEQARGADRDVDRRTDVYALGATLYELFAGKPPFHDSNGLDAMHRIVNEEPKPLAAVAEVPRDLSTVVMKCLEKAPLARYDSARALGDDLQRILDGDPILARPVSTQERIHRWTRKNRLVVAVGAAGLLAALVLGGWGIRERVLAGKRAAYAQRFGQEAERIEALMRYGRVAPPHDLGREREAAWARLERLKVDVEKAGDLARGPGSYALGRSWTALGEEEKARAALEGAWDAGFRSPEASYALGRNLAALYVRKLAEVARVPEPGTRKAAKAELEASLKAPALAHLQAGRGAALEPAAYQEGLLALVAGDPRQALDKTRQAFAEAPWFYEAKRLEAEVRLVLAQEATTQEAAAAHQQAAGEAAREALAIAPSDPALLEVETRVLLEEVDGAIRAEQTPDVLLARMERQCKAWEGLGERKGEAYLRLALGYGMASREPVDNLRRREWLSVARRLHDLARQTLPETHPGPSLLLATLLLQEAKKVGQSSVEKERLLAEAMNAAKQARAMDPSSPAINHRLMDLYVNSLEDQNQRGKADPQTFKEAMELSEGLTRRFPEVAIYPGAMGVILVEQGNNAATGGEDPEPYVSRALPWLEEAIRRDPLNRRWVYGWANAHLVVAEFSISAGKDPGGRLTQAESGYLKSLSLAPFDWGSNMGLAMVEELRGRVAVREGGNPGAHLRAAQTYLGRISRKRPGDWTEKYLLARLALIRVKWAATRNESPRAHINEFLRLLAHLKKTAPTRPELGILGREWQEFNDALPTRIRI